MPARLGPDRATALVLLGCAAMVVGLVGWHGAPPASPRVAPSTASAGPAGLSLRAFAAAAQRFHGGPARDGRSPYRGPHRAPVAAQVRRFAVGAPITGQAVVDGQGAVFAAHDGALYGIGPAWDLRFRTPLGGTAFAGPLRAPSGDLWVGTDAGALLRLSSAGVVRERLQLPGPVDTTPLPLPRGGIAVAAGNTLWAVLPDGRPRALLRSQDKLFTTPVVGPDGCLYIAGQDDTVTALDPGGSVRFRVRFEADIDAGPMWAAGRIWVADDAGVVRGLSPLDGAVQVRRDLGRRVGAPLSRGTADTVLVSTYGPRAALLGLDPADGRVRFEYRFDDADDPAQGVRSGPLVDRDGFIYAGAHDGGLHALGPDGTGRWVFRTAAPIDAGPVLGPAGTLYFGGRDGTFYGIVARRDRVDPGR